jgi:hypothetical protein
MAWFICFVAQIELPRCVVSHADHGMTHRTNARSLCSPDLVDEQLLRRENIPKFALTGWPFDLDTESKITHSWPMFSSARGNPERSASTQARRD